MSPEESSPAPPDEPIVIELDGELRHVRLSEAALAMVGMPSEALVGKTPAESGLPAEVVVPLERELRVALDTGEERHLELEMPTNDGLRWLFLRLVPDGEGAVRLQASDITVRKHAELRLTGGHAAFRALVEDSPDPVARVNADGRIGFVNAAFEQAVGQPAAAFLGRRIAKTDLPGDVGQRWADGVRAVFARGERLVGDFRFPAEGGARWYSARLLPEPGPSGAVEHVISAFTDITDRVNQEAEQAALRRVATVVAREGDLDEIGRVVAEEATHAAGRHRQRRLPLRVAGHGNLRRRPPAGRGRRGRLPDHVHRRHHRDRPHGEDRRARPRRRLRRAAARPVGAPGARGRPAQRHRGAARRRAAASGAPSRPARPSRARSAPPRSAAWRPSRSSRPSPSPTPRPAPSSRAWPRPTPSPGSPTGAPSRSGSTARSSAPAATATC